MVKREGISFFANGGGKRMYDSQKAMKNSVM